VTETDQEIQKKRLIYRATHRGTKEADAIVGGFVTTQIDSLTDTQRGYLERVLDQPDADLMDWLRGHRPLPVDETREVLSLIKEYQQSLLSC